MVKTTLHRIAAHPWVYDRIQSFFGLASIKALLRDRLPSIAADARILDIGGGTGLFRDCVPITAHYTCLDIDLAKLKGFRSRYSDGVALLADGLQLPIRSKSVDIVLCVAVAHH